MNSRASNDFADLVAMGFLPEAVTHALSSCPNAESALDFLLSSSPPEQSLPGSSLSPKPPAAMHRSYRIRVRKLDNQSVVMGGWLPCDSTLHTLASEIVRLGHAGAGSFSILLPQHQLRPPATHNPDAFDASLESCGIFGAHMTITLQRFLGGGGAAEMKRNAAAESKAASTLPATSVAECGGASAREWSPPPSPSKGIAPRGRINSQKVRRQLLPVAQALELPVAIPLFIHVAFTAVSGKFGSSSPAVPLDPWARINQANTQSD